jgi:hypothetical protein
VPPRPDVRPRRRRRAITAVVALAFIVVAVAAGRGAVLDVITGPDGDFRVLRVRGDGTPYRWDPCGVIHFEVHDPPAGVMTTVLEAVARVEEATGIAFEYDGLSDRSIDTRFRTMFENPMVPGEPRWAPVLIDWVPSEHFHDLAGTQDAAAFGLPWPGDGALEGTYVSGLVAIDEDLPIPPGFGSRLSLGVVLMHELAHVMGLDHVRDGAELMWSPDVPRADPFPDLRQNDWGPGDLRGLHAVGRRGSCPGTG